MHQKRARTIRLSRCPPPPQKQPRPRGWAHGRGSEIGGGRVVGGDPAASQCARTLVGRPGTRAGSGRELLVRKFRGTPRGVVRGQFPVRPCAGVALPEPREPPNPGGSPVAAVAPSPFEGPRRLKDHESSCQSHPKPAKARGGLPHTTTSPALPNPRTFPRPGPSTAGLRTTRPRRSSRPPWP